MIVYNTNEKQIWQCKLEVNNCVVHAAHLKDKNSMLVFVQMHSLVRPPHNLNQMKIWELCWKDKTLVYKIYNFTIESRYWPKLVYFDDVKTFGVLADGEFNILEERKQEQADCMAEPAPKRRKIDPDVEITKDCTL
eukprot:UN28116